MSTTLRPTGEYPRTKTDQSTLTPTIFKYNITRTLEYNIIEKRLNRGIEYDITVICYHNIMIMNIVIIVCQNMTQMSLLFYSSRNSFSRRYDFTSSRRPFLRRVFTRRQSVSSVIARRPCFLVQQLYCYFCNIIISVFGISKSQNMLTAIHFATTC